MKTTANGTRFDAADIANAFGMKPPTPCASCGHESRHHRVSGGTSFDMGACLKPDRRTSSKVCKCELFVEPEVNLTAAAAAERGGLALLATIAGMSVGSSQTTEGQARLESVPEKAEASS
ncbi:hypothetical protein GCM10025867_51660 (plasmid) [Frondihabitans sucicola]|uniref:Uncharacterized protein n=1 Tax=Frondihabitans sucicola TaxID=1268041 RepID=A0ABM8GV58_9MICO|nr:hypothetical protein [Frondihabitans sucicola]BDZ52358.1 hypothetical protein GCM10025867_45990 [Frondihabitans sucicola]BDZ52925.1 hypothetical protein GCM10025867_51660 [Frondihabitans sucicola]